MMNVSLVNSVRALARRRVLVLGACCALVAALPMVARTRASSAAGIRVVNNSALEISHLYLSPPDRDAWSGDQLGDSTLRTGESFTISNVTCAQADVKIVAEDRNGCFLSQVVSCADGAGWTIPAGATPDCGN